MKNEHYTITLLGNNSGRNLGDAAILSSIMEHLSKEIEGVEFYVPSISPNWIKKNYGDKYRVHPVNVMPWTLSLRLLGLPVLRCFAKSDAALICDGIIFGKKLFNPAFNYLITLFFLVPFAKLFKCKLVCYNCGIGPFPSKISQKMARYVINNCDLITMRENDSKNLAKEIGVTAPIELTGDSAFINPVDNPEVGKALLAKAGIKSDGSPIFGFNVTKYLDTWLDQSKRIAKDKDLITIIAEGINQAKERLINETGKTFQPVIFCTQPMDLDTCKKLSALIQAPIIDNAANLSHQIQAAMRECGLFVGMRFHSLILASAVRAPIVGLIYAPKVEGYMRLLDCQDQALELNTLTSESLASTIIDSWKNHEEIQTKQQKIVDQLCIGARYAAKLLKMSCLGIDDSGTVEERK